MPSHAPRRGAIALALLFALPFAALPASAESGLACGLAGWRLEGECYGTPAPGCDPDADGERTRVIAVPNASGEKSAFVPNSTCSLTYASVTFPTGAQVATLRAQVTGSFSNLSYTVTVAVDGVAVGSGTFQATQRDPAQVVAMTPTQPIAAGAHVVRITYSAPSTELNLILDYVDFAEGSGPCPASTPRLEAECAFLGSPGCTTTDGETARAIGVPGASGGQSLFLPATSCRVTYDDVVFSQASYVSLLRAQVTGSFTRYSYTVRVFVDDALVGVGVFAATQTEPARNVTTVNGDAIAAGVHDVRVEYSTNGPSFINLLLDHVEFAPLCSMTSTGVLGGECYTRVDPRCFPDMDGESTTRLGVGPNGRMAAFIPNDLCGLAFDEVVFEETVEVTDLLARTTGSNLQQAVLVEVVVDGELVAEALLVGSQTSPFAEATILRTGTIFPGTRTVEVYYFVPTNGATNLLLDEIRFGAPRLLPVL